VAEGSLTNDKAMNQSNCILFFLVWFNGSFTYVSYDWSLANEMVFENFFAFPLHYSFSIMDEWMNVCVVFKGNQFIGPQKRKREGIVFNFYFYVCFMDYIMLAKLDVLQIPNYYSVLSKVLPAAF